MTALPDFYSADRIGTLFYPDVQTIAQHAYRAGISPAENDDPKTLLLIVDMQIDFCHEQGTLFVPGATADIRRVIEFIYRNAGQITRIVSSLDSHLPHQIFHATWWVDAQGRHPDPYTVITRGQVETGQWQPVLKPEWSRAYVRELEEGAEKALMIWPYHVPIGGIGNMLDPELWSAIFWHSIARMAQPVWWVKGTIPETEHYSVVKPEVKAPGQPSFGKTQDFLKTVQAWDRVFIVGEASSHCVQETIEDMLNAFGDDPEQLSRFLVLRDTTSPVQHPEIDFAKRAEEKFSAYEKQGIRFANSTDEGLFE